MSTLANTAAPSISTTPVAEREFCRLPVYFGDDPQDAEPCVKHPGHNGPHEYWPPLEVDCPCGCPAGTYCVGHHFHKPDDTFKFCAECGEKLHLSWETT